MRTNLGYRGEVDITLNRRNGTKVCKYHNAGTKFLFSKIVSFLMGESISDGDNILFLNAVGITTDTVGNETYYELLNTLPLLSLSADSRGTTAREYGLTCTGAISHRDIDQDKLKTVIDGNGEIHLALLSANVASDSAEDKKRNLDYAYATIEVEQSFLPSIEPGIQAIIEWKMIFSNSEGDE